MKPGKRWELDDGGDMLSVLTRPGDPVRVVLGVGHSCIWALPVSMLWAD